MLTSLSRVFKAGWQTFSRNSSLSLATVGIKVLTLFVFTSLVLFSFLTREVVGSIQEKIDISLYFKAGVDEAEILKARDTLRQLPEVKTVEYVSREEALTRFRERHSNNEVIIQALEELGSNPLQPSLEIKANEADQYAAIATFVEQAPFKDKISKINFLENQSVIERLNKLARGINRAGITLIVLLAAMASLITFNTIRMGIYSFREEIAIMKLVGASNWFARGPFVVTGVLASLIGSVIAFLILWPAVAFVSPRIAILVPGTDLYGFFLMHLFSLFLLQTFVGVALGAGSSMVAINKYLKV